MTKITNSIDKQPIIIHKNQLSLDMETAKGKPHIEFVALSNQQMTAIIRPELNLEKFSNFLFPHRKAIGLDDIRSKSWNLKLSNGLQAEWKIVIEPSKSSHCYTDRTKDVYLALTQIYYMQGMPEWPFKTSIREIARYMGVQANGKWLKQITEELDRLYKTTISWILSFHTDADTPQTVTNQHILSVYNFHKMKERADNNDRFQQTCEIDFDRNIKENLRKKKTAPINLTSRLSISSPVQRVLFDMLDTFLANQTYLEMTATTLVNELNLWERYRYLSKRKNLLEDFQQWLNDKLLSTLKVLKVSIKPTADGKDVKCCFRAEVWADTKAKAITHLQVKNPDIRYRQFLIQQIVDVVWGEKENRGLYELYALYYSENAIMRALGEFKEKCHEWGIESRLKYFTATMHRVVHALGYEWIKPCGKSCKFRPKK